MGCKGRITCQETHQEGNCPGCINGKDNNQEDKVNKHFQSHCTQVSGRKFTCIVLTGPDKVNMYQEGNQEQKGRDDRKIGEVLCWCNEQEYSIPKNGENKGNENKCESKASQRLPHGLYYLNLMMSFTA